MFGESQQKKKKRRYLHMWEMKKNTYLKKSEGQEKKTNETNKQAPVSHFFFVEGEKKTKKNWRVGKTRKE